MEIKELLKKVKNGEMELSRAEEILKELPYENLGYANLDHHRQLRNGYGETIYCESKTAEQIEGILHSFQKRGSNVMGTRVKPEQYIYLKERFPELIYHPEARVIMLMDHPVEQVGMAAAKDSQCMGQKLLAGFLLEGQNGCLDFFISLKTGIGMGSGCICHRKYLSFLLMHMGLWRNSGSTRS